MVVLDELLGNAKLDIDVAPVALVESPLTGPAVIHIDIVSAFPGTSREVELATTGGR